MYPDLIITDSYTLNNSERLYKLATQGKDMSELRKTKQKYRKRGKIRWTKHSRFSRFLSLPRKFSREFLAIHK